MRCVECETNLLTPEHFCECCGRQLPLEERNQGTPDAAVEPEHHAHADNVSLAVACQSCGAPTDYGDLCHGCHQAFSSSLGSTTASRSEADGATAGLEAADVEAAELEAAMIEPSAEAAKLEPPKAEETKRNEAPREPARTEAFDVEEAPTLPTTSASETEVVQPTQEAPPAAVSTLPSVSDPPQHRNRAMMQAAALVLTAAASFVVGLLWLKAKQPPTPRMEQQIAAAATHLTVPERRAKTPPTPERQPKTPTAGRGSTPAPPPARATTAPPPSPSAVRREVQQRAVRPPAPSRVVASPSAAASPRIETPPPAVEVPALLSERASVPPAVQEAVPLPTVPPEAPQRPFFEPTDVTESPRVATRVEPRLPEDLLNHPMNDVVVVRLLVSQTGHPFRVSLLRRSKAGLQLDDAVMAAVNQWTFSPAVRKGQAVSSWYNLGVPIGGARAR